MLSRSGLQHAVHRSLLLAVTMGVVLLPVITTAETLTDLQQSLRDKQQRIEDLKKQAATYETNLRQKQREGLTLSNQLTILSDRITKTKIYIETTKTELEATSLEIKQLEQGIGEAEQQLGQYRSDLSSLVRWLARRQDRSLLQVFFTYSSFASFYNELRYLQATETKVVDLVTQVQTVRAKLQTTKTSREEKSQELNKEAAKLTQQQLSLEAQEETKKYLLEETKSSEKRYAALLQAAKQEQEATSREITLLEQTVRERLKAEGIATNGSRPSLIWPVPNTRGISALFHDPDYPFRVVFEHSGVDIRAYQGTPVRAAASGYVARVQTGGKRGYGYVMLIHNGGLATVYGHISKIYVKENSFVAQGEVIAASGGLPGTPGAGPFTTGAHLHFETRLNGIPVNPLPFLGR